MKSVILRLCLAVCVGFLAFHAPARAQDHTQTHEATAEEQAELESIVKNDLLPSGKNAQSAIDLATSDPAKACELAKTTVILTTDAQQRFGVLYAKMVSEGVDVSSLEHMKAMLATAPDKMNELVRGICGGQFAAMQNDPAMKYAMKIGAYMKAYNDDSFAADTALGKGDNVTFCQRARDGASQLVRLSAYVSELRKKKTLSASDLKGLDKFEQQIVGFKATNDARLQRCPAQ